MDSVLTWGDRHCARTPFACIVVFHAGTRLGVAGGPLRSSAVESALHFLTLSALNFPSSRSHGLHQGRCRCRGCSKRVAAPEKPGDEAKIQAIAG